MTFWSIASLNQRKQFLVKGQVSREFDVISSPKMFICQQKQKVIV